MEHGQALRVSAIWLEVGVSQSTWLRVQKTEFWSASGGFQDVLDADVKLARSVK
jgi:hypothetical protein